MRTESKLFGVLIVFFFLVTPIYWILSQDITGTVALVVTFLLACLLGFYTWFVSTKIAPRPEDRSDSEVYEGAGEVGFFSPHSIWPLYLGASAAMLFLGLAIGWWLVIIAVPLVAASVVGWVFEYYRGDFAH